MDLALLGFVAVNFAAACSGAVFKPGPWYDGLAKPWWCPPKLAFPIVWTILFAMMAVSGWIAWHAAGGLAGAGLSGAPWAFALYGLQLALNAGWSAVFFGMKRPDLALVEVCALWLAILATVVAFADVSLTAALLLLPYLAWVTIAAALNRAIVVLNPQLRAA